MQSSVVTLHAHAFSFFGHCYSKGDAWIKKGKRKDHPLQSGVKWYSVFWSVSLDLGWKWLLRNCVYFIYSSKGNNYNPYITWSSKIRCRYFGVVANFALWGDVKGWAHMFVSIVGATQKKETHIKYDQHCILNPIFLLNYPSFLRAQDS